MRYKIETERTDLFDVSIVITMCLKLAGDVPFDMLKNAFDKACTYHEVLGSKIVIEPDGEAYYEDAEKGTGANTFSQTDLSLEELIYENERRRFRIEDGEFIRGFSSPSGIVLMMHHLGGDGKSLLYFTETFMKCLNGETCEFMPFRSLDPNSLPEDGGLPCVYKMLTKHWNRKWSREKRIFTFADMDAAYTEYWKDRKTKITITKYEKDEWNKLLESARRIGVSVTALLITDMIRDSQGKKDIGLAVDGRTDGNRSMGNQATGISVEYGYVPDKSFEENAMAVHALMKRKLSDDRYKYFVLNFMGALDPALKDALNLEHAGYFSGKVSSYLAQLLGYGTKVRDISITNLTRADIPVTYGEYGIKDLIFIPPVVSYAKNVYGIVTAGERMYVVRHIFEQTVSE